MHPAHKLFQQYFFNDPSKTAMLLTKLPIRHIVLLRVGSLLSLPRMSKNALSIFIGREVA